MNYDEFHNHKWAKNLALALGYWKKGDYERLWRGDQLSEHDFYPGLRVMSAYWASVEHEMPLRLSTFLRGSGHEGWLSDPEVRAKCDAYLSRYLEDMVEIAHRDAAGPGGAARASGQAGAAGYEALAARLSPGNLDMPEDWADTMRDLQAETEATLATGAFPRALLDRWFGLCLRSVANYNRFLIRGATCAATVVKREGIAALRAAVDRTSEAFMWDVSKAFFATALPKAGFEDIGDLMELGLRGMYADQYFHAEPETTEGELTTRVSVLENCELAGIYASVERWEGLPPTTLGYAFCRYCEVHGLATMMITMPPMVSPSYVRRQSLGMDGKACRFALVTKPADDMARILEVQDRVFGSV